MDQNLKDKRINEVIDLFTSGMLDACIKKTWELISLYYSQEPFLFNLLGVANGAKGNFEQAIISYKEALNLNSQYFEVYNNIGVAYTDWGKPDLALEYLEKALDINPKYAEAFNNIGNAKKKLSEIDLAIESYKKAIELNPEYVDALCNLGICFVAQKKHKEAIHVYEKADRLKPDRWETKLQLAKLLLQRKDTEQAKIKYEEVISINAECAEAYNGLGLCGLEIKNFDFAKENFGKAIIKNNQYLEAINNYGIALLNKKDFSNAIKSFESVLKIDGNYIRVYSNLGKCYFELGNLGKAKKIFANGLKINSSYEPILRNLVDLHLVLQNFEEAEKIVNSLINKNPKDATLYSALGSIYEKKGDLKEAEKFTKKALKMDSLLYSARSNLATIRQHYGDHPKARTIFEELIKEDNENPDANNNLGNLYLMIGHFSSGWEKYDYRWKVFPLIKATWPIQDRELWEGQDRKKVLLWKEQGIGDDILFLGLVLEAYKRTKVLTVYTDSRLISLCERGMPGVVFKPYKNKIDDEDFDYHLPMGSLPRLFRNDIKDFENTVTGYLKADKDRVESLREELGLDNKKVVGISWKSIKSLHTQKKSLSLKEFGTLFKDLDIVLLNLQYGDVDNEIKEFTKSTGIKVLQCGSVDNREDLDGLAALIELCDLVVSTSNVTVHLAGALGKETWVLLPYVANFWWLLDRTDSIWYPTLKLYRQNLIGNWGHILFTVNRDLQKFIL